MGVGVSFGGGEDLGNMVSAAVMLSKDAREGPRAFKEKREPRFTGE